jgi:hypothetical protein
MIMTTFSYHPRAEGRSGARHRDKRTAKRLHVRPALSVPRIILLKRPCKLKAAAANDRDARSPLGPSNIAFSAGGVGAAM